MRRRALLVAIAGFGTAGCVGDAAVDAPVTSAHTTTPADGADETTARRGRLTQRGALDRIRRLERRRVRERLDPDRATEISLSCAAVPGRRTTDGFVAFAGCGGYAEYPNSVADLGGNPTGYYVTADETVRVPHAEYRRPRDDPYAAPGSEANLPSPVGLRVYNFSAARRTFRVRLVHRDTGQTAYQGAVEVLARAAVHLAGLTRRLGAYDLRVAVDGGPTATDRWRVDEAALRDETAVVATLAPGDDLGIDPVALGEIRSLGPV